MGRCSETGSWRLLERGVSGSRFLNEWRFKFGRDDESNGGRPYRPAPGIAEELIAAIRPSESSSTCKSCAVEPGTR